jgi:hypothetical protein
MATKNMLVLSPRNCCRRPKIAIEIFFGCVHDSSEPQLKIAMEIFFGGVYDFILPKLNIAIEIFY